MIDIDRKYKITAENPCSGNRHTEKDSVLFLAKDKAFLEGALPGYRAKCVELKSNPEHIQSIDLLIERVTEFQKTTGNKVPDTDLPCEIKRCIDGDNIDNSTEILITQFFEMIEVTRDVVKSTSIEIITRYIKTLSEEEKVNFINKFNVLISNGLYSAIKAVRLLLMEIKLIHSESIGNEFKLTDIELKCIDQQLMILTRLKVNSVS